MTFGDTTSTPALAAQGGATALAAVFFQTVLLDMIPYFITAIILIAVDFYFGVCAAAARKETVRISRAIRRTVSKLFEYLCWIMLSATLAVTFKTKALEYVILAVVMGNELLSIVSNWAFVHGKKVHGLDDFFLKFLAKKTNTDTSDIKIEDIDGKEQEEK